MKLQCRIVAETGTPERQVEAAEVGITAAVLKLGIPFGITALRDAGVFPTLTTGQVDARILERNKPWAENAMNVWLTSRDLSIVRSNGQPMNFIYGLSAGIQGGHMIASGFRLDQEQPDNPLELATVVLHETGHTLGLVEQAAQRHSTAYGFEGHCSNDCTMEASNNRGDITRATDRLVRNLATSGFCGECLNDLRVTGAQLVRRT